MNIIPNVYNYPISYRYEEGDIISISYQSEKIRKRACLKITNVTNKLLTCKCIEWERYEHPDINPDDRVKIEMSDTIYTFSKSNLPIIETTSIRINGYQTFEKYRECDY